MEKQDLENLQQITKDYSMSATWLSGIMMGVVFMICGLMTYFKIGSWNIINWIFVVLIIILGFASQYLTHAVMRKGLGYVGQKGEITSLKQELSREQTLIISLPCLAIFIPLLTNWNFGIVIPFVFLGLGFIFIIAGLINRKKQFFYGGVYFIICALIWMGPMKHIFYTHEMAPRGIVYTALGLWLVMLGILNYLKYKSIIQKVKGTN
ncbi:MAG: hypothetical protein PHX21_02950 [bacterium]|nr:hypothetical protein [bacterium]